MLIIDIMVIIDILMNMDIIPRTCIAIIGIMGKKLVIRDFLMIMDILRPGKYGRAGKDGYVEFY